MMKPLFPTGHMAAFHPDTRSYVSSFHGAALSKQCERRSFLNRISLHPSPLDHVTAPLVAAAAPAAAAPSPQRTGNGAPPRRLDEAKA